MGGFAEGLGSAFGAMGGAGPTYRGYRVKKGDVNQATNFANKDLRRLYGEGDAGEPLADPWEGPGLGYSPEALDRMDALSEGDRTAEMQDLHDSYARSPYGTRGREYLSARAGVGRAQAHDMARGATSLAVANEEQKRRDLHGRLDAARGYRGELVGDYNDYATRRYGSDLNRFNNRKQRYAAVGELIGSVADAYTGGL